MKLWELRRSESRLVYMRWKVLPGCTGTGWASFLLPCMGAHLLSRKRRESTRDRSANKEDPILHVEACERATKAT